MRYVLFTLFIVVPALEIGTFLFLGHAIGVLPTVLLIILTGFLGVYIIRRQKTEFIKQIQQQMSAGQPPGNALIDGFCTFVGAILILTPGLITDVLGFLLLMPFFKRLVRPYIIRLLRKWFEKKGQIYIYR